MNTATDLYPWFDQAVEYFRTNPNHPILNIVNRYPTRQNLDKLIGFVVKIPNHKLRNAILRSITDITHNKVKNTFRFRYHTYPKCSGQSSATGELFSILRQAITYPN